MSELAAAQTRTQPTKQRAYKMLIGGRWQDAKSGATIESVDPSTEEVIATIPDGDEADVAEAVEAGKQRSPNGAHSAQPNARKGCTSWPHAWKSASNISPCSTRSIPAIL